MISADLPQPPAPPSEVTGIVPRNVFWKSQLQIPQLRQEVEQEWINVDKPYLADYYEAIIGKMIDWGVDRSTPNNIFQISKIMSLITDVHQSGLTLNNFLAKHEAALGGPLSPDEELRWQISFLESLKIFDTEYRREHTELEEKGIPPFMDASGENLKVIDWVRPDKERVPDPRALAMDFISRGGNTLADLVGYLTAVSDPIRGLADPRLLYAVVEWLESEAARIPDKVKKQAIRSHLAKITVGSFIPAEAEAIDGLSALRVAYRTSAREYRYFDMFSELKKAVETERGGGLDRLTNEWTHIPPDDSQLAVQMEKLVGEQIAVGLRNIKNLLKREKELESLAEVQALHQMKGKEQLLNKAVLIDQILKGMDSRHDVLSQLYLEINGINRLHPNIVAKVFFSRVLTEAEKEAVGEHRDSVSKTRDNLLDCMERLTDYQEASFRAWIDETGEDSFTRGDRLFKDVSGIEGQVEDILYGDRVYLIPDQKIWRLFADKIRKASLIILFGERVPSLINANNSE